MNECLFFYYFSLWNHNYGFSSTYKKSFDEKISTTEYTIIFKLFWVVSIIKGVNILIIKVIELKVLCVYSLYISNSLILILKLFSWFAKILRVQMTTVLLLFLFFFSSFFFCTRCSRLTNLNSRLYFFSSLCLFLPLLHE